LGVEMLLKNTYPTACIPFRPILAFKQLLMVKLSVKGDCATA
jgi:hypothetical protein